MRELIITVVQDSRVPGDNVVLVTNKADEARTYARENGGREDWNWSPFIISQKTLKYTQ